MIFFRFLRHVRVPKFIMSFQYLVFEEHIVSFKESIQNMTGR